MVDEVEARRIAELFICKQWGMPLSATKVVFMSAARRREVVLALVRKPEEIEVAEQLAKAARDHWAVGFDTVLSDGARLVEETTVCVDAATGEVAFG
jgi:hypothetical protein